MTTPTLERLRRQYVTVPVEEDYAGSDRHLDAESFRIQRHTARRALRLDASRVAIGDRDPKPPRRAA